MTDTPTTPPVPAPEDDAVERNRIMVQAIKDATTSAGPAVINGGVRYVPEAAAIAGALAGLDAALDAAGVPALRAEVGRLRREAGSRLLRDGVALTRAENAERERDEARQQVADLRGRVEVLRGVWYSGDYGAVVESVREFLAGDTTEAGVDGRLCDGCNVREPFEHRCLYHDGVPCGCGDCAEERRLFDRPTPDAREAAPVCGWEFPLPGWAGEDQMDPCVCDLPAGHPPTDHKTRHSCSHIRGEADRG